MTQLLIIIVICLKHDIHTLQFFNSHYSKTFYLYNTFNSHYKLLQLFFQHLKR